MTRASFGNESEFERSLDKNASDDLKEKLIEFLLLACGLVSVFTT